MGSGGMKRRSRVSGDKILRSGRRLFSSRYEETVKRMRLSPVAVVVTQQNKIELLDHEKQESEIKLGETKKVYRNGIDEAMGIDQGAQKEIKENGDGTLEQEGDIKLGEFKKRSSNQFRIVYTRKRKRNIQGDSILGSNGKDGLKSSSLEEICGFDKMYKNKYFTKRVRTSLGSGILNSSLGSNGKDGLWKGPVLSFGPCSYNSSSSSSSIYGFSCFVSSVLRYMRKVKVFSWRQFSSFLLSELALSIYSSIDIQFSQDSNCNMGHGFLRVFGSVLSIPLFTLDFISLPFCFLYIHSSLLLKFTFLSYALILHPVVENVMEEDIKVPSNVTRLNHFGKFVLATKPRSSRKRLPRVSLFKKWQDCVDNDIVPVPGVKEIAGYEQEEYIPFRLPDLYISATIDEVTRTLQKSYPIYDMDSVDEEWLKKFNNERFGANESVSEDTFEKVIDAFERGIYRSPNDYSDATSAVDQCVGLASKEVLEAVYRYWMTKRRKKRSPLVRVFQCYQRRRVRKPATNTVLRKKRSPRRRKNQYRAGKHVDFLEAMMNQQNTIQEATKAYMKVHETQEDVRRSEAAAIVKRQEAQALMEAADLATYRATMALRIAEALAAATGFFHGE